MGLRKFRRRGWHWSPLGHLEWDEGAPFEDFLLQIAILRMAPRETPMGDGNA